MQRLTPILVALLACVAAVATATYDLGEAHACSPAEEHLSWHVPSDGTVVPEDPELFAVFGGILLDREVSLVETQTDEQIDVEQEKTSLSGFMLSRIDFVPDEPLTAGEYELTISYDDEDLEYRDDYSFSFSVDDSLEPSDPPMAPDFGWRTERERTTCYGDRVTIVDITVPENGPDYYDVRVLRDDGSDRHTLVNASGESASMTMSIDDPDCVTVTAVLEDGTESASTERCSPDRIPGCGCSTVDNTNNSGGWMILAVLVGLVGLRRLRRPSTSTD